MDNNVTITANVIEGSSSNPNVTTGATVQVDVSYGTPVTGEVATGAKGDKGDTGATGAGVATGGTTNQILRKASATNYDTEWHTLDKSDVGLSDVDNTSDIDKPVSTAQQTAIDAKVTANGAITGATKTKVTYDSKGLVTAGADATTADVADSSNKRYVTDANLVVINNTSGVNTGDQDLSGYVQNTRTVNGHALSSDVTVSKSDVGLGNVTDDAQLKAADLDTDGTLAANSDSKIASQKATKTYVDTAVTGLLDFKGSTDCSSNPNYPAASKGDAYIVSVAGKIGGAGGKSVDVGDVYLATADNAGGTEAAVGSSWSVLEHNLTGALLSANNLSDVASASTSRTNLGLGTVSTLASDTDGTLAANSDTVVATQKATKTYSDTKLALSGGTISGDLTVQGATGLTVSSGNGSFYGGRFILGLVSGNAGQTIGLDASKISIYRVSANRLGLANVTNGVTSDGSYFTTATVASGAGEVMTVDGTQTATNKTFTSPVINTGVSGTAIDTDGTLAANSDTKLASQKASKTYSDTKIPKSQFAAKGDLISATAASTPAILSVSANDGYVLQANSAESTGLKWAAGSRMNGLLTGQGLIIESFDRRTAAGGTSTGNQTVIGTLVYLFAGDVITNIHAVHVTANTPTNTYVGLYDSSGNRLRISGDLVVGGSWTGTGVKTHPLTSSYTITSSGVYYLTVLQNGGTATTLLRAANVVGNANDGVGGGKNLSVAQTGQATMPASATFASNAVGFWLGCS